MFYLETKTDKDMKKKIERWIAKKLGIKPDDVMLEKISVEFTYVSPVTFETTKGIREIKLKDM